MFYHMNCYYTDKFIIIVICDTFYRMNCYYTDTFIITVIFDTFYRMNCYYTEKFINRVIFDTFYRMKCTVSFNIICRVYSRIHTSHGSDMRYRSLVVLDKDEKLHILVYIIVLIFIRIVDHSFDFKGLVLIIKYSNKLIKRGH